MKLLIKILVLVISFFVYMTDLYASEDIRIYKYKLFFDHWDIPYEKINDQWKVNSPKSENSDWVEITNSHTIGYFFLQSDSNQKQFRTEPLLIGVKYGQNNQISAGIECDGDEPIPLNDKHQLIGFNDEYLVCAYNFSNDNPEKINIYYDHNQRFSIPVNFHKKRPTYVTTKENSLFF
jgi:hypothetical protein